MPTYSDRRAQHAEFTLLSALVFSLTRALKRGMAADAGGMAAAPILMAEGNYQIVLCEPWCRTFAQHTRNTLDLAAVRREANLTSAGDCRCGAWDRAQFIW